MKEYEEVRSNLLEMLLDLDERLGKITGDVKHTDGSLPKDSVEQAVETENDQVLDALGNLARNEIKQVKQAIARIDSGEYGVCVVCGQPIREERLKARPFSDKCIRCAEQESLHDRTG